jgi:hypothetical protein
MSIVVPQDRIQVKVSNRVLLYVSLHQHPPQNFSISSYNAFEQLFLQRRTLSVLHWLPIAFLCLAKKKNFHQVFPHFAQEQQAQAREHSTQSPVMLDLLNDLALLFHHRCYKWFLVHHQIKQREPANLPHHSSHLSLCSPNRPTLNKPHPN